MYHFISKCIDVSNQCLFTRLEDIFRQLLLVTELVGSFVHLWFTLTQVIAPIDLVLIGAVVLTCRLVADSMISGLPSPT